MEIITGRIAKPWMGIIYGVPGIGKSTWATQAPAPLFLDLESGLTRIDCHRTPKLSTVDEIVAALKFAYENKDYSTVVIDTIDALEEILRADVCKTNGWKSIEAAGYGKGYVVMQERLLFLMEKIEKVQQTKNILFVGHETIRTFSDPSADAYDRYILKAHKNVSSVLIGRVDFVFFAQYETLLRSDRGDSERLLAIGSGKRLLRTSETPSWIAKNRFGLPPTVDMSSEIYGSLI